MKDAIKKFRSFITAYTGDISGATAVVFAMAVPVLVAAIGLAVDMGQAYNVKNRLGHALDASVLATASMTGAPDDITERAEKFFETNFPDSALGTPFDIEINISDQTINMSARARVNTSFMKLFGKTYVDVYAEAEAKIEAVSAEVALVLDITGSMSGQRIVDLKSAASELVNLVIQDQIPPFYKKIALVPYSMAVNVGGYANQIRGSYTNNTCTWSADPTCRYYQFRRFSDNNWTTQEISTCVSERFGAEAYTDAPPSTALMGKVYPAPGSYNPCPSTAIVPLTDNKTLLLNTIDNLGVSGSTAGQIGVAWGWYMVSPNFGYLWPEASRPGDYGDDKLIKVVIMMTDGEFNSVYRNGVLARDSGSGSGTNAYKINQYSHNGNPYTQALSLCDGMKDEDVVVYTIGFDVSGIAGAQNFIEECATSPAHVYLPNSGTELKDAFRQIAGQISTLHLSK